MLPYFKKYTIYVCAIAVALPVIVSTVWPFLTGQIMAASVLGLLLLFALFIAGLFIGYSIFGKKADATAEGYLEKYNDDCDPEALVKDGAELARSITFPVGAPGAWYMGYYAQALVDLGRIDEARSIESRLVDSVTAAKKPAAKVGIIVNLLPLSEKLDGCDKTLQLAEEGLKLCDGSKLASSQERDFIASQKKILEIKESGDAQAEADFDEKIRANPRYPMRLRVEYAWDEASAQYRLENLSEEESCLRFVADHGNKLALAAKARERLSSI